MKSTLIAIAGVVLLSPSYSLSATSPEHSEREIRIGAGVLAGNICSKFARTDEFTFEQTRNLVNDFIVEFAIFGSGVQPTPAQTVEVLNKYGNDMFCVDAQANMVNYMTHAIARRKNYGLIDLYFLDFLMGEQEEVLIDFNVVSKYTIDRKTREPIEPPIYETVLDTLIRDCDSTQDAGICSLREMLEEDEELGAKRYSELSDSERSEFSPLPEVFQ